MNKRRRFKAKRRRMEARLWNRFLVIDFSLACEAAMRLAEAKFASFVDRTYGFGFKEN